jgi:uncharacterized protein
MLTIPLARLQREGSLQIRGSIPAEDPGWEGTELAFLTPLTLSGQAQWISSGEVIVRVGVLGKLAQECRRCLEPVTTAVEEEVILVFAPKGENDQFEDETLRPLPEKASELNLGEAIREEIILSQTPLALCQTDCLGLCPSCGANRNVDQCQCSDESEDPRWDALRALRDEREIENGGSQEESVQAAEAEASDPLQGGGGQDPGLPPLR